MIKLLKDVLQSSKAYNAESAAVVPSAYIKMRDSMMNVDKEAASSIKVETRKR